VPTVVIEPSWLDPFVAAGATATVVATAAAGGIALFRGRKGTVVLTADAYLLAGRHVVAVRPSLHAVGVFRLNILQNDSAITVTEILGVPGIAGLQEGRVWQTAAIFGDSFVDAGEGLSTSVVFDLGPPAPDVVGWRVSATVAVSRFLRRTVWTWDDRLFLAIPGGGAVPSTHAAASTRRATGRRRPSPGGG